MSFYVKVVNQGRVLEAIPLADKIKQRWIITINVCYLLII